MEGITHLTSVFHPTTTHRIISGYKNLSMFSLSFSLVCTEIYAAKCLSFPRIDHVCWFYVKQPALHQSQRPHTSSWHSFAPFTLSILDNDEISSHMCENPPLFMLNFAFQQNNSAVVFHKCLDVYHAVFLC